MERRSKSSVLWCWVWTLILVHLNLCCFSSLPSSLTLSSSPLLPLSSLPSPSFSSSSLPLFLPPLSPSFSSSSLPHPLLSSLFSFLPSLSPSLLSPSLTLLLPPSPLSPASQFLSVIQPGQTSAQKEALLGVSPGQDRHTVGQPRANGGEHWVHANWDESGGGSEARKRVPWANAQGLVKIFHTCTTSWCFD